MATSRTIGNPTIILTANAEQAVGELKKLDAATKAAKNSITGQVDQLVTGMSRRFSSARFGREILQGLGIGGGFAIAQKGAELIAQYWKEAAEAAKAIEESSAKQLASLEDMLRARRTDAQELVHLQEKQASLYRQLNAIVPKAVQTPVLGFGGAVVGMMESPGSLTNAQIKQRGELAAELQAIAAKIQAAENTARNAGIKTAEANVKALQESADAAAKYYEQLEKGAEATRKLIDPTEKYREQIRGVVEQLTFGAIDMQTATKALALLNDEIAKLNAKGLNKDIGGSGSAWGKGLEQIDENARTATNSVHELDWAFQSAFENAIINGDRLSDVLHGLLEDMARMFLRQQITGPMMGWLGGLIGSVGFGGGGGGPYTAGSTIFGGAGKAGYASGGDYPPYRPFVAGERGPELVWPGARGGSVIPNSAMGGLTIVYNIQSGVTRQELRPILDLHAQRIRGEIMDAGRRGGSPARGFGR